jgi:hypothetical protein
MTHKALGLAAFATVALAGPAAAHHSFSMFDQTKVVTLKGTVRDFEWANPHTWIRIMVNDESGKPMLWAIEGSSPARLRTIGLHANSMKPGDIVTVSFNPMKDGTRGGRFVQAVLSDGHTAIRDNVGDEDEVNEIPVGN